MLASKGDLPLPSLVFRSKNCPRP